MLAVPTMYVVYMEHVSSCYVVMKCQMLQVMRKLDRQLAYQSYIM